LIREHRFYYRRQGRCFLGPSPSAKEERLVVLLHGYGQQPKAFLEELLPAQGTRDQFLVPEGLHRFYLQGSKGTVGSSWMTREDREADIADYVRMLEELCTPFWEEKPYRQLLLFAFSQGVATAYRWLCETKLPFGYFIAWAGSIPPDLNYRHCLALLPPGLGIELVRGTEDRLVKEEDMQAHATVLRDHSLQPTLRHFSGRHRVEVDLLKRCLAEASITHPGESHPNRGVPS